MATGKFHIFTISSMLVFLLTSANLIYPRWLIDSNSQDYVGLFKNCEHSKERDRVYWHKH